ncbi:MAG TPA: nicotinate-nucleotide adenylyltransferase [Pyrinomonadaceae bacterium]|jgi:nicotinate-nucleotide adenylyltransferase
MEGERRIALYGGTFDPAHVGHLTVARNLSTLFGLDEVLFIPAYVAPHKRHTTVTPAVHRVAMLALATQQEPRFRISTAELDAPERPYTIETLTGFKETIGRTARLFFVMGADSWMEIRTWREWERVLGMCDQIVVTRPGYELSTEHVTEQLQRRIVDVRGRQAREIEEKLAQPSEAARIYLSDAATVDVSSTEIRRAARTTNEESARWKALVPPPVADYIRKYGLYRNTHETEFTDAGRDLTAH